MKKIAILTIDSLNCGNRLQNYALQSILQRIGHGNYKVETIQRNYVKNVIYRKIRTFLRKLLKKDEINEFHKFRKYITWSKYFVSDEVISEELNDVYDAFIIGSDQVWNITFPFISQNDFLPMVDKNKKISYAASFGISEIPENYRENYIKWLSNIKHISVREDSGKKIVSDLIERDVSVVLDPTMLLNDKEWMKIEKKPKSLKNERYVCKYILGNDYNSEIVKLFAEAKGLTIIDLRKDCLVGPREFVYLIHHADLICTDSFHAMVFSFLFEKPFVVFDRKCTDEDMSSRIDTMCSKFGLHKNRYDSNFNLEDVFNVNWNTANQILEEEREKSLAYLSSALNDIIS